MGALISFFGGSAFRMIWGEVSHYFTAKQEHQHEIARMDVEGRLKAAEHERNMAALRLQSELGIKEIEVKSNADQAIEELRAWAVAVADVGKSTGIKWLDAWNGAVRPFLATLAILMVCIEIVSLGFAMTDWHRELFGAILGIFVADRSLKNRGK